MEKKPSNDPFFTLSRVWRDSLPQTPELGDAWCIDTARRARTSVEAPEHKVLAVFLAGALSASVSMTMLCITDSQKLQNFDFASLLIAAKSVYAQGVAP